MTCVHACYTILRDNALIGDKFDIIQNYKFNMCYIFRLIEERLGKKIRRFPSKILHNLNFHK